MIILVFLVLCMESLHPSWYMEALEKCEQYDTEEKNLIFCWLLLLFYWFLAHQGEDNNLVSNDYLFEKCNLWLPQWPVRQMNRMNKLCCSGYADSWPLTSTVCAVLNNICLHPPLCYDYHPDHEELFSWYTRALTWWNQLIYIIILLLIAALLNQIDWTWYAFLWL